VVPGPACCLLNPGKDFWQNSDLPEDSSPARIHKVKETLVANLKGEATLWWSGIQDDHFVLANGDPQESLSGFIHGLAVRYNKTRPLQTSERAYLQQMEQLYPTATERPLNFVNRVRRQQCKFNESSPFFHKPDTLPETLEHSATTLDFVMTKLFAFTRQDAASANLTTAQTEAFRLVSLIPHLPVKYPKADDLLRSCSQDSAGHVNAAIKKAGEDHTWIRIKWHTIYGLQGQHRDLMFRWMHENDKLQDNTMRSFILFMNEYDIVNSQKWFALPMTQGFRRGEQHTKNVTEVNSGTSTSQESVMPHHLVTLLDKIRDIGSLKTDQGAALVQLAKDIIIQYAVPRGPPVSATQHRNNDKIKTRHPKQVNPEYFNMAAFPTSQSHAHAGN
jgi:hypothetical protein